MLEIELRSVAYETKCPELLLQVLVHNFHAIFCSKEGSTQCEGHSGGEEGAVLAMQREW